MLHLLCNYSKTSISYLFSEHRPSMCDGDVYAVPIIRRIDYQNRFSNEWELLFSKSNNQYKHYLIGLNTLETVFNPNDLKYDFKLTSFKLMDCDLNNIIKQKGGFVYKTNAETDLNFETYFKDLDNNVYSYRRNQYYFDRQDNSIYELDLMLFNGVALNLINKSIHDVIDELPYFQPYQIVKNHGVHIPLVNNYIQIEQQIKLLPLEKAHLLCNISDLPIYIGNECYTYHVDVEILEEPNVCYFYHENGSNICVQSDKKISSKLFKR